eukprot:5294993-Pleurochrysis_carterae.AAC.1
MSKVPDQCELDHACAHFQSVCSRIAGAKCPRCWLCLPFCICSRLRHLQARTSKVNVQLAVHYKEYGTSSNTAKLLPLLLNAEEQSDAVENGLFIYPIDCAALDKKLRASPTLLLWPGPDSQPASSYRDWVEKQNGRVNLVVIDGTWTQARAMARGICSSIPRVHVNDAALKSESLFIRRKQTQADRVSSVEAAALALSALGEPSDVAAPMLAALRLQVDSELVQSGFAPVYGSAVVPDAVRAAECGRAPWTPSAATKPTRCACCGSTRASFKSLGRRPLDEAGSHTVRVWRCRACKRVFRGAEEVHDEYVNEAKTDE